MFFEKKPNSGGDNMSVRIFREAAKSFNGEEFTKEQLKEICLQNGMDESYFNGCFRDATKKEISHFKLEPGSEGHFKVVTSSDSNQSVVVTPSSPVAPKKKKEDANIYWPKPDNTNGSYDYVEMILGAKKKDAKLYKVNQRFLRLKQQWQCASKRGKDKNRDYVVLINKANSDLIEEAIQKDQGYIQFAKRIYEYEKITHNNTFPREDVDSLTALIRMIDIENSTQVWRYDREALKRMVNYVADKKNKFWKRLEKGEPELVDDLTKASKDQSDDSDTTNGKKSLASKICKYLAEYDLEGKKKYAYYINDSFVRRVIIPYIHYYMPKKEFERVKKMKKPDSWSYAELFEELENLHNHIAEAKNINRSQFDHIMWYCYKESGDKEE